VAVGWLAPLWPFIGICIEIIVLVIIIAIYETRRSKQQAEEARKEEAQQLYDTSNASLPYQFFAVYT